MPRKVYYRRRGPQCIRWAKRIHEKSAEISKEEIDKVEAKNLEWEMELNL